MVKVLLKVLDNFTMEDAINCMQVDPVHLLPASIAVSIVTPFPQHAGPPSYVLSVGYSMVLASDRVCGAACVGSAHKWRRLPGLLPPRGRGEVL